MVIHQRKRRRYLLCLRLCIRPVPLGGEPLQIYNRSLIRLLYRIECTVGIGKRFRPVAVELYNIIPQDSRRIKYGYSVPVSRESFHALPA